MRQSWPSKLLISTGSCISPNMPKRCGPAQKSRVCGPSARPVLKGLAADSYEQAVNQQVYEARAAHQPALAEDNQAETYLATQKQKHEHWQAETIRRHHILEKALSALSQSLEKHFLDLAQLTALLKKDDGWLTEQKTAQSAQERALQEAAALSKVKKPGTGSVMQASRPELVRKSPMPSRLSYKSAGRN
ncbi:hypothetical protein METHB2_270042 [Candidatus Methylobacter favarea]|uniref:Uncharacterized protein n=1 Tax=Candidatus Methylobacter favarea TaxID=2707345 RepID=A0A8S0XSF1_9GAMM|nr:hypothetical protein [Candidatus Methylobacter favarea]CAA9890712.1 hypothetical protein METHB2_270042 [Candidatus Methylobacter favarea]